MADEQPSSHDPKPVARRKEQFTSRIATRIWHEKPSADNPYIAEAWECHGYDMLELMRKRRFPDVVYLLFKGELPSAEQSQLFEHLMIAFINPGPRHPATRAAMNAGVGKTEHSHILPISLSILGGEYFGGAEVEQSIRWLRKNLRSDPATTAEDLVNALDGTDQAGDRRVAPGFGSHFASADLVIGNIADHLLSLPAAGEVMRWADSFSSALSTRRMGWLSTGLVAAVLADLGFQPRWGAGVFQIMSAPGLFAHGIEMAGKPLTAMPFPEDKDYHIENGNDDI